MFTNLPCTFSVNINKAILELAALNDRAAARPALEDALDKMFWDGLCESGCKPAAFSKSASREIAMQAGAAHILWLQTGCDVVEIYPEVSKAIRANPMNEIPAVPKVPYAAGLVRFVGPPLEFAPASSNMLPLRVRAFYWWTSLDEDGVETIFVVFLTLVRPDVGLVMPAHTFSTTELAPDYVEADLDAYPGFSKVMWRVLERIWAEPAKVGVLRSNGAGKTSRLTIRQWDGKRVRTIRLQEDPVAQPVAKVYVTQEPPAPPVQPELPPAKSAKPELSSTTRAAPDHVVKVPGYRQVKWLRADRIPLDLALSAQEAGLTREGAGGVRLCGVEREVSKHDRNRGATGQPPERVTRLKGPKE